MNMTDQEEKKPAKTKGEESSAEERYRYIGFDVFPKQAKPFWKSDSEEKSHLEHVKESGGHFVPLSRSNSIMAAPAISRAERLMIGLSSLLLLLSPFLPWFSVSRGGERFVYSGYVMLLEAGAVMDFISLGQGSLTTSFILLAVLMLVSMLFGLATLYVLFVAKKSDPEGQQRLLHRILNWHYLPIIGWVVFFSMTASPMELPFGPSLGLAEISDSVSLVSLTLASTIGLWVPFGALWVNAIKGNDL
jgi:hypothetical protein